MKQNNNQTSGVVTLVVVGILVIGGAYAIAKNPAPPPSATEGANFGESVSGSISDLIGKPLPQFSLRDKNETEYSPAALKGKNILLFFNEGIMCYPSCWNQIVALAKDKRFEELNTVPLSVVIDSAEDWQRAAQKMPELGYATILFDTGKKFSREIGMLTAESSMHYGSFPGHSYVLADGNGIVRYVFDDPRMAIQNDRIVAEIQKLQ